MEAAWDFGCGLVGFVGFECLRIYKTIWAGGKLVPLARPVLYAFVLVGLGLFSGFGAAIFATGSAAKAIVVGFSVPSGLKAISDQPTAIRRESEEHHVDDIPPRDKRASFGKALIAELLAYLRFS